jgi:hypothetical protein
MTIIVWRGDEMCCDTGVWASDYVTTHETMDKVIRLPDGSLLGSAGEVWAIQVHAEWARAGFPEDKKPEPPENRDAFGAILVTPNGDAFLIDHKFHREKLDSPFAAEGSHGEFAYACLLAGCSAAETVALAIKHTSHCAGRVVTHRLVPEDEAQAEPPEPTIDDVLDDELPIAEPAPGSREFYGL